MAHEIGPFPRLLALSLAALLALASSGDGDDDGDGSGQPDAAPPPPGCITEAQRAAATANLSGQVVDFADGTPVAGVTVHITTAWDVTGSFREDCPPIVTVTTDAEGRFNQPGLAVGSIVNPPVALFMVEGAGRARTLSDQRLNSCNAGDCGSTHHTIRAPSAALAAAWRTELAAGGMVGADARGLVLFEFRELDGTPAAGVIPTEGSLTVADLVPGAEVRFLDADRATLAGAAQASTLASGLAVIGVDSQSGAAFIGGRRGSGSWAPLGVLVAQGWFFLEDKVGGP